MDGKKQGAHQHQQVAAVDPSAAARHTQHVQAHHSHNHGPPDQGAALFAEKQPEKRHDHNVAGRDKSGLAHRGVLNAHLLKRGGNKKHQAAETAAYE